MSFYEVPGKHLHWRVHVIVSQVDCREHFLAMYKTDVQFDQLHQWEQRYASRFGWLCLTVTKGNCFLINFPRENHDSCPENRHLCSIIKTKRSLNVFKICSTSRKKIDCSRQIEIPVQVGRIRKHHGFAGKKRHELLFSNVAKECWRRDSQFEKLNHGRRFVEKKQQPDLNHLWEDWKQRIAKCYFFSEVHVSRTIHLFPFSFSVAAEDAPCESTKVSKCLKSSKHNSKVVDILSVSWQIEVKCCDVHEYWFHDLITFCVSLIRTILQETKKKKISLLEPRVHDFSCPQITILCDLGCHLHITRISFQAHRGTHTHTHSDQPSV